MCQFTVLYQRSSHLPITPYHIWGYLIGIWLCPVNLRVDIMSMSWQTTQAGQHQQHCHSPMATAPSLHPTVHALWPTKTASTYGTRPPSSFHDTSAHFPNPVISASYTQQYWSMQPVVFGSHVMLTSLLFVFLYLRSACSFNNMHVDLVCTQYLKRLYSGCLAAMLSAWC